HAVIDGGPGRKVIVNAPGAGDSNPYVQGLSVNGQQTSHTWLMLPTSGSTVLNFTLGSQPNQSWGTGAGDGTPPFAPGPVTFPPSTRAPFLSSARSTAPARSGPRSPPFRDARSGWWPRSWW